MPSTQLWTISRIATHFDVPTHRVLYIVRTRGIAPADRAGNARVFDDAAVGLIGNALRSQEEQGE